MNRILRRLSAFFPAFSVLFALGCSESPTSQPGASPVLAARPATMDELASRVVEGGDPRKQEASVRLLFLYDDGSLTAEKAVQFEKQLGAGPDNWQRRVQLAGHYYNQRSTVTGENAAAREAYEKHALYLIEHHASIPGIVTATAFLRGPAADEAARLWSAQADANPDNPVILAQAVEYLKPRDLEKATEYALRGKTVEPENMAWIETLADLASASNDYPAVLRYNEQLLDQRSQTADASSMERIRFKALGALALAAWRAGEMGKADVYANEILSTAGNAKADWNVPAALHSAHVTLGLIAAQKNNVDAAKQHLADAAAAMKESGFSYFDARMDLAQRLLEAGEREVVVEYLKQYAELTRRKAPIEEAIQEIQEGKTPKLAQLT